MSILTNKDKTFLEKYKQRNPCLWVQRAREKKPNKFHYTNIETNFQKKYNLLEDCYKQNILNECQHIVETKLPYKRDQFDNQLEYERVIDILLKIELKKYEINVSDSNQKTKQNSNPQGACSSHTELNKWRIPNCSAEEFLMHPSIRNSRKDTYCTGRRYPGAGQINVDNDGKKTGKYQESFVNPDQNQSIAIEKKTTQTSQTKVSKASSSISETNEIKERQRSIKTSVEQKSLVSEKTEVEKSRKNNEAKSSTPVNTKVDNPIGGAPVEDPMQMAIELMDLIDKGLEQVKDNKEERDKMMKFLDKLSLTLNILNKYIEKKRNN